MSGHLQLYAKTVVAFAIWAASWVSLIFVQPGLWLGLARPRRARARDRPHRLLRPARREPRRLLPHPALQPPDGLDGRLDARLLELRVAREAQRRPSHVHERRRLRRRHQPDAVRRGSMPTQAPKPWYRLQHIYIWPLYSVMVIRWQTGADIAALIRRRIGKSTLRTPRRWDLAGLLGGKGLFIALGDRRAAARLSVVGRRRRVCRLHDGDEPRHRDDVPARALRRGGRLHLGRAARGRASGSGRCTRSRRRSTSARATPFLTWVLGGLNYQIEHHLFPRVPHTHYPRIAEIVRRNAAKHGVRYTAQPSLWVALRSHHRHLRSPRPARACRSRSKWDSA